MSLKGAELKALVEAFVDAYNEGSLTLFLRFELDKRFDTLVPPGTFKEKVYGLLDVADSQGWLEALVLAAWTEQPGNTSMIDVFQRLGFSGPKSANPWTTPVDHFNVCLLERNQVFVNRESFRDSLQKLTKAGNDRVLLVNGPCKTGKTYSKYYIRYLANSLRTYHFAMIDLTRTVVDQFGPGDLASSVVGQITGDLQGMPPPRTDAQPIKWVQELRDWIIREVLKAAQPAWIVIDGFGDTALPDLTQDLIHDLAIYAHLNVHKLRVVLLGYKKPIPEIDNYVLRDKTHLLERKDLIKFFQKLFKERSQLIDQDALEALAEEVFQAVSTEDERRMKDLEDQILFQIRQIFPEEFSYE